MQGSKYNLILTPDCIVGMSCVSRKHKTYPSLNAAPCLLSQATAQQKSTAGNGEELDTVVPTPIRYWYWYYRHLYWYACQGRRDWLRLNWTQLRDGPNDFLIRRENRKICLRTPCQGRLGKPGDNCPVYCCCWQHRVLTFAFMTSTICRGLLWHI